MLSLVSIVFLAFVSGLLLKALGRSRTDALTGADSVAFRRPLG